MREHELKTWPSVWHDIESGLKTWEFRQNDRDFCAGDKLLLQMWDPATRVPFGTQSRGYVREGPLGSPQAIKTLERDITYIIHGGRFGIPEGYCIMSLSPPQDSVD